jgi:hypothetical protein
MRTALQNPSEVVKQKVLQLVVDRIAVDEQQWQKDAVSAIVELVRRHGERIAFPE